MRFEKLYIIRQSGVWWKHKVGVSLNPSERAKNIGNSKYVVIWLPMTNAAEGAIHNVLRLLRAPKTDARDRSGQTEWFWSLNPISGMLALAVTDSAYVLLITFVPFAFDAFLFMVVTCVAQWTTITAIVACAVAILLYLF
jgi:hypothetical protein